MTQRPSLTRFLIEQQRGAAALPAELRSLIERVARACKTIGHAVTKGALGEVLGSTNCPDPAPAAWQDRKK